MGRKLISICIIIATAAMVVFSPVSTKGAYAAQGEAEKVIKSLGIMKTDQGNLNEASETVTRAQFAQLLVNISSYKNITESKTNLSLYTDVSKNHWAAGYIERAVNNGWMSGYLNGSFRPDKGVTLQEAVKAVTTLLGYTNNDYSSNVLGGQMALYRSQGLNENIKKSQGQYLNVTDCINLFYNLLNGNTKSGVVYAQSLGYSLNSDGKPDYLSIVDKGMKGPILVDVNWKGKIPFSLKEASFYRDGVECTQFDYNDYDLIYYSEELETIWGYDDKVTASVNKINPDKISPQSVNMGGKEYYFENSSVAVDFSTMGDVKEGDAVTLVLGKSGKIAYVLSTYDYASNITGIVLETGSHIIKNSEGNIVSSEYIVFVDADGNEHLYDYDNRFNAFYEGDLVRISYKDGDESISEISRTGAPNAGDKFSSDGKYFGENKLASNVKILDIYEDNYVSVNSKRLVNTSIHTSSVIYYEKNKQGAISQLILSEVTGDQFEYGILTGFASPPNGQSYVFNYDYIIDGKAASASGEFVSAELSEQGPKGFIINNNQVVTLRRLHETEVTSIDKIYVYNKDNKYPLDDNCDIYFYINGEYIQGTIDDLENLSNLKVSAYYDKAEVVGGRVRIIIAENIN